MSEKAHLLDVAQKAVEERGESYGTPHDDFQRIAHLWDSLYLPSTSLTQPHQVAMFLICVKLSRLVQSPGQFDSWVDIAGYAACGWECVVAEEKGF